MPCAGGLPRGCFWAESVSRLVALWQATTRCLELESSAGRSFILKPHYQSLTLSAAVGRLSHDPIRDLRASRFNPILFETTPASCGIIRVTSPESSSRRGRNTGEANDPSPARWVVNQLRWKCHLLSLLRIQHPDCELCNARETCGDELRKRLEELNWRTPPHSLNKGVFDSKPGEVAASPPLSLKAEQQKKIA